MLTAGCGSASRQYQDTHGPRERELTVGTVQKEIHKGMSAAAVAEALGSPNIVTTDEQGREVWIYDRISTDVTYSQKETGGGIYLIIAGAGAGKTTGAASKTQKTLTVIIKYDENKQVRDFAYHSSKF
ncbi:hypothetical protein HS125_18480 [bacterium]|nr:hypothetical protein [bacterium]